MNARTRARLSDNFGQSKMRNSARLVQKPLSGWMQLTCRVPQASVEIAQSDDGMSYGDASRKDCRRVKIDRVRSQSIQ
jgi:hypothetical protein